MAGVDERAGSGPAAATAGASTSGGGATAAAPSPAAATALAPPPEAATALAARPAAAVAEAVAAEARRTGPPQRPTRRPAPEPARGAPIAAVQVLLLLAAAALSGFTILRGYAPHDEGTMLAWAQRIAGGEWPYRDFWANVAPAQPLLLAGLVKLLGPSLVAWRVVRVAVGALTALAAYRLVRRDAGEGWALAAWAAVAGAMASPSGPDPVAPALGLALAAQFAARRSPGRGGALAGLAFAFQPEIGIAAAIGAALEARSARPLARAAAVGAIALAPFAYVARSDMADQLLRFGGIRGLERLPLVAGSGAPPLERLFPLLLVLAAGGWTAWALWRRPAVRVLALAPLVVAGLATLLARADAQHLAPLSVALAVALALAAAREASLPVKVAIAAALALVAVHGVERRAGPLLHPPRLAPVPGAVAGGVRTSPADARALRRVLRTVRRRTAPGRPVLVAPPRFDRVRAGDPLLNVLLRRPSPTRYDAMLPGVVTTAAVQREMARDLVRSRAPVVVRWIAPAARASGRSSRVHLLDHTIARRYRRVARYGDYVILARRR